MTWLSARYDKAGNLTVFFGAAIQFCTTIEVLFELSPRQTSGIVASNLKLVDLNLLVRDCTSMRLHRRKTLPAQIPYWRPDSLLSLCIDGTGIKFLCDGELQAR